MTRRARAEKVLARATRALETGGGLWGPVNARWIVADAGTWWLTEPTDAAAPAGRLWHLPAPADAPQANTAVALDNRSWALLMELPEDDDEALVLALHEAWHAAVEPRLLGSTALPPAGQHLASPAGAAAVRAEIGAWTRAVDDHTQEAVQEAIRIHEWRRSTTPATEWERQRILVLSEGLAEYSALRWAGARAETVASRCTAPRGAGHSLVRSFCYALGPVLGYSLDIVQPTWRARITPSIDLVDLFGLDTRTGHSATDIERTLAQVGYGTLLRDEEERWAQESSRRARLRNAVENGPVLHVPCEGIDFDPRTALPCAVGTLYENVRVRCPRGAAIAATSGLAVAPDWQTVVLPCPMPPEPGITEVTGKSWTFVCPEGWDAIATWESHSPV